MSEIGEPSWRFLLTVELMELDDTQCYAAVKARDGRFDGWFFVGVSSTRIYCRPVCAVKTPKSENCSFYKTAAAAEGAGFRPCLRCRPELAPGHPALDAVSRLVRAAAALIDEGFLNTGSVAALAQRIGVTERHLRRIFFNEFNVTPLAYARTQRRLLAKRLLADTSMSLTRVSECAGFGSLRSFNAAFAEHYHLSPSALRRGTASPDGETLSFKLAYRAPFAWQAILQFLSARTIAGVESAAAESYARTAGFAMPAGFASGWLKVENLAASNALRIMLSPSLAGAIPQALGGVRRLFDLGCRPDVIDAHLGPLSSALPGLRVPGTIDGFEIAVRAIVGQQISLAAARTMLGRLVEAFGSPLASPSGELLRLFPSAEHVAALPVGELRSLGLIPQRAQAIVAIAQAITADELRLDPHAPLDATLAGLARIKGVGDWTIQYIAMRALAWPNAFPAGDLQLRQRAHVKDARELRAQAECWAPWRAYAALHLWGRSSEVPA